MPLAAAGLGEFASEAVELQGRARIAVGMSGLLKLLFGRRGIATCQRHAHPALIHLRKLDVDLEFVCQRLRPL